MAPDALSFQPPPPQGNPFGVPPAKDPGAATSVLKVPTGPTVPLSKLAPEAALRRLELTLVRRLEGFLHGDHLGLLPGPGSDTNDARVYQPGQDDVRKMDWAVTARTTVPHVRDTMADRELEVWALLDVTPSMNWGTEGITKKDLGIAAIATIGFLSQKMGDRFGGMLMKPDHVTRLVGAGNTLVLHRESGSRPATVHNTDVPGFVRAWRARGLGVPRTAVIVGNGATARSLLVALAGLHVTRVIVLARDPARAARTVELGIALGVDTSAQPLGFVPSDVDLVANTIPSAATVGYARAWADAAPWLFDAVYHPWPTPLGAAAAPHHTVLTGLDLLAGQAVDQFHLLTGGAVTFDDCHSAALAELRSRTKD